MKKWYASLMMCALLVLSSLPASAMGEKTLAYDTSARVVFGFGHGKKAVREEAFGKFLQEVVSPAFKDGFCTLEARGQRVHPEHGFVREKNVVLLMDYMDGPDAQAAQEKVVSEFLSRFPGSNAAVYVVVSHGITAKIYF